MALAAHAPADRKRLAAAADICAHIRKVFDAHKLYAAGHSTLAGFVDGLYAKLTEHLDEFAELPLGVQPTSLSVEGRVVYECEKREESIASPLSLDGVQKLVLSKGLTRAELQTLLDVWIESFRDGATSSTSFVTRLWDAQLVSVRAVAAQTFAEGDAAQGGELETLREDNVAAAVTEITSGRLGNLASADGKAARVFRATREDLKLLRLDALAELTADGLRRQDTARRAPQADLDGAAAQALAAELSAGSVLGDPALAAESVAWASFAASQAEGAELRAVFAKILASLARARRFRAAGELLARIGALVRTTSDVDQMNLRAKVVFSLVDVVTDPAVLVPLLAGFAVPGAAPEVEAVLRYVPPKSGPLLLDQLEVVPPEQRPLLARLVEERKPRPEELARRIASAGRETATVLVEMAERLGPAHAGAVRGAALEHADRDVRLAALRNVKRADAAALKQPLLKLLSDPSEHLRRAALSLLVGLKEAAAAPILQQRLARGAMPPEERRSLIAALGMLGGVAAASALRHEFSHQPDLELRCAAALGLGQCGDLSARPLLEAARSKLLAPAELKKACAEALLRLDEAQAGRKP